MTKRVKEEKSAQRPLLATAIIEARDESSTGPWCWGQEREPKDFPRGRPWGATGEEVRGALRLWLVLEGGDAFYHHGKDCRLDLGRVV